MNKNIDLTKILKNCPKGWKLYSSAFGEVEFQYIELGSVYPIIIKLKTELIKKITSNGKLLDLYDVECTLFPSKEQRDWSKFSAPWYKNKRFDPMTLQPFDKVLARYNSDDMWKVDFYSHKGISKTYPYRCIGSPYTYCIPYNNDTKHLIGTTDEAPEYYRYWKD